MTLSYRAFLEAKRQLAPVYGKPIAQGAVNPITKPHQEALIRWGVQGGRRAYFAKFGLGKTLIQLETMRLILKDAGGTGLIVCPLGMRQEFIGAARDLLGFDLPFIRTTGEMTVQRILVEETPYVFKGKQIRRVLEILPIPRNPASRRSQERFIAQVVALPYRLSAK